MEDKPSAPTLDAQGQIIMALGVLLSELVTRTLDKAESKVMCEELANQLDAMHATTGANFLRIFGKRYESGS